MRTQPNLVTLSKPGIPLNYRFLQNESHLQTSRLNAISDEKLEAIIQALSGGQSKAAVCRNFGVKRSTLYDALNRSQM